ncbi:MAG: lysylphosphatidylglycerol synthase transmembrane domain-containing protein [Planctomycetaceae bacterium]
MDSKRGVGRGLILLRLLGVLLIVLVLWLVGWNDRVRDETGVLHKGRILREGGGEVLLRTDGGERTLRVKDSGDVHRGMGGAVGNLAQRPGPALLAILVQAVGLVSLQVRWGIFLRGAGLPTPWPRVVRLGTIGLFFNQVLPAGAVGGDLVKAYYAAREHPARKHQAVVSVLADRGIGLFVICLVAAAAVLAAPPAKSIDTARRVSLILLALSSLFLALLFLPPLRRALGLRAIVTRLPFSRMWEKLGEAFALYGRRPGTVLSATLVSLLCHACMLGTFYGCGVALGIRVSSFALFVAIPVAQMVSAVPGLPAGWGVSDLAFFVLLPTAGVPAASAVALSFAFKIINLLLALPGGFLFTRQPGSHDRAAMARELGP